MGAESCRKEGMTAIHFLHLSPLQVALMQKDEGALNTTDRNRDAAGLTYIYPVISHRAYGMFTGVSIKKIVQ